MIEASVHQASPDPISREQVKIAYLDRGKKTVRVIFLSGPDKGHNLEYGYADAAVDGDIRTGDAPIDAILQEGRLCSLKFPPGLKPAQSPAVPASQPNPPEPAKVPEKPKQGPVSPPIDDGKWRIKLLKKQDGKALILKNNGQEEWFDVKDKAVEKIVRLKEGQLVKLRFEGTHIITDINPVDETGEYDKTAWSSGGGKGGGGRPYDPEAEKRRQLLIVRQSCLDRAVSLWIAVHAEHAGEIGTDQEQSITNLAEGFERWVMR